MAFVYRIQDLKPIRARDVPVGSVLTMLDSDQTLYVRIDLISPAGGGTFVALNGDLRIAQVSAMNMDRKVLCLPAGEMHLSVDAVGGRSNDIKPGQVALSEDGPVLCAKGRDGVGFDVEQYVSMSTWQFIDFPGTIWAVVGAKLMWRPEDPEQDSTALFSF